MHHDLNFAHGSVSLNIEFLAADVAAESVQVNIKVSHLTTDCSLDWAAFEEWVREGDLSRFEEQLASASEAALLSATGKPLIRVFQGPGAEFLEIGSAVFPASHKAGNALARVATEPGLGLALGKAFREYAKWW